MAMVLQPSLVWINRDAISWKRDEERKKNSCYWSEEILNAFRPLCNRLDKPDAQNENDDDSFLRTSVPESTSDLGENGSDNTDSRRESASYKTLLLLAAGVVQYIREEYTSGPSETNKGTDDTETNDGGSERERITFAVAIPEGPMLPLSILVVHALNASLEQPDAVLVPMDPDEGKDRNLHILKDANPSFILAIPGKDLNKLQTLTEKGGEDENNDNSGGEGNRSTKIINFVELVAVSRKRLLSWILFLENRKRDYCIELIDSLASKSLQQMVSELANKICATMPASDPEETCAIFDKPEGSKSDYPIPSRKISHIVYTSGTTGRPKGCVSSTRSLINYIIAKNEVHDISGESTVLLASSLSFDPCLSDVVATFQAKANLAVAPRETLISGLAVVLQDLKVTHVLCTPTLWSLTLLHTPSDLRTAIKDNFPHLQRVALGGEPIPKSIVQAWARSCTEKQEDQNHIKSFCRLLATYGVTEACVYQTCGEVFRTDESGAAVAVASSASSGTGQYVGHALQGTKIKICQEEIQGGRLVEVAEKGMHGEIVLFGDQVDICTRYLNRPDLDGKFVAQESLRKKAFENTLYHYRTGDRGYINPSDGSLSILGRIFGEEGMIKINGVRVELGEIEAALMSDDSIVTDCLAKIVRDSDGQSAIHAYCVLSDVAWKEVGISQNDAKEAVIINGGPLWTLLRVQCSNRLRKACVPSTIVGIRQLPLSRTGKRDRSGLPSLNSCSILNISKNMSTPLKDFGLTGKVVVETLVQYLNLQPCQQQMLTKSVSFAVLGGDSLSAAVVCRTLYAHFHQIQNSRFVGGEYGQLPVPFDTATLLHAQNLGEYVNLLDESIAANKLQYPSQLHSENSSSREPSAAKTGTSPETDDAENALLYDALLQATTLNQSAIAIALLNLGADPNHGHQHGSRIGNTSGRNERRAKFKAAPLHLASFRGEVKLLKCLLDENASYKSPNTNGLFPIHLAAGGLDDGIESNSEEDARRLECVKLLLASGCPLLIKDANKQSILHAAARAGHCSIIEHAIAEHQSDRYSGPVPLRQFIEFQDRWFRSAVHWATLNGRVVALKLLLEKGCDPTPFKPKSNKQTSMVAETPLEICQRMHAGSQTGIEMKNLLMQAMESRSST